MFKDLKIGDNVFILENTGTFRKVNTYNVGTIVQTSQQYEDIATNPYLSQSLRKKLVDITITCEGVQKKLTVGADKTTTTDNLIGLTISTDKQELINQVENQCREYEQKIKAIESYKVELNKCHELLKLLGEQPINNETIKVS